MSKFAFVADQYQATSPKLTRAYAAGRAASVAAAAISTNPHASPTPEWAAWRNGHNTYTSGGANTLPRDGPAQRPAFADPAVTMANVGADATGATWGATPAAPGLPFRVDWGDGLFSDNPAASVVQLQHKYAASGAYNTRLLFMYKVWDLETITVTIV